MFTLSAVPALEHCLVVLVEQQDMRRSLFAENGVFHGREEPVAARKFFIPGFTGHALGIAGVSRKIDIQPRHAVKTDNAVKVALSDGLLHLPDQ